MILDTKAAMKNKPVILSIGLSNPMVFTEFEKEVYAIIVDFGVQVQAFLEIIAGVEPSGLLPVQMPVHLKTVELQNEDVPHDMEVHIDEEGNKYDFAFGLNFKGVIQDQRTSEYKKEPQSRR
jgi:beta-glucosidase